MLQEHRMHVFVERKKSIRNYEKGCALCSIALTHPEKHDEIVVEIFCIIIHYNWLGRN